MLLDILFPKRCLGCNLIGVYICNSCRRSFPYITQDLCIVCEKPGNSGFTHKSCRKHSWIDGYLGILRYKGLAAKIIKNIKYRGAHDIFHELFLSFHPAVMYKFSDFRQKIKSAAVQPITLHEKRQKARGFNQAEIIAGFFSQTIHYPVIDILIRVKETKPQAAITSRRGRSGNISGAFAVRTDSIVPKDIILVDDVVTSAYTVNEAAKVLKGAGAKNLYVFTLARG